MNRELQVTLFLLLIVVAIVSLPILQAGFFYDDIVYSSGAGAMQLAHLNLWQYTLQQVKSICLGEGRILLVGFFNVPFFYYFQDPLYYQIVRVIFIWFDVLSAAWFVQLITKNIKVSLLFIVLFPLCWSIGNMSNALLAFGLMFQALLLFMMLSLCFFVKWLENKNFYWLPAALLSYGLALTMYEIGLSVLFCIGLLIWHYRQSNKRYWAVFWFVLVTACYLILYWFMRKHNAYNGTAIGAMNGYAVMTFLFQLTGQIPLFFGLLRGHYLQVSDLVPFLKNSIDDLSILVLFVASWLLFYRLIDRSVLSKKQSAILIVMAIILSVFSSFLMAISLKYEDWLRWGLAYLPLYIQYVSMVFFLLCLLSRVRRFRMLIALVLSFILCLSWMFNMISVKDQNNLFKYPRALDDQAIHAGLLNNLPNNAVLMTRDSWINSAYLMQHAGLLLQPLNLGAQQQWVPDSISVVEQNSGQYIPKTPLFLMVQHHVSGVSEGVVMMGQVQRLDARTVNGKIILSGILLEKPLIFSSFGGKRSLVSLSESQYIQVSWVCENGEVAPCL